MFIPVVQRTGLSQLSEQPSLPFSPSQWVWRTSECDLHLLKAVSFEVIWSSENSLRAQDGPQLKKRNVCFQNIVKDKLNSERLTLPELILLHIATGKVKVLSKSGDTILPPWIGIERQVWKRMLYQSHPHTTHTYTRLKWWVGYSLIHLYGSLFLNININWM